MFQQITQVFRLQRLIGYRPPATVFHASLRLVLFNVLQLVRGYVAGGRPEPGVESVLAEQIFADLTKELVGLHEVLTIDEVVGSVSAPGGDGPLRDRLGSCWAGRGRRSGRRYGTRRRDRKSPRRESPWGTRRFTNCCNKRGSEEPVPRRPRREVCAVGDGLRSQGSGLDLRYLGRVTGAVGPSLEPDDQ